MVEVMNALGGIDISPDDALSSFADGFDDLLATYAEEYEDMKLDEIVIAPVSTVVSLLFDALLDSSVLTSLRSFSCVVYLSTGTLSSILRSLLVR